MIKVIVPFDRVATFEMNRTPRVLINSDVLDHILLKQIRYDWLIGPRDKPMDWKVMFNFQESADAIMFKLTFGGR